MVIAGLWTTGPWELTDPNVVSHFELAVSTMFACLGNAFLGNGGERISNVGPHEGLERLAEGVVVGVRPETWVVTQVQEVARKSARSQGLFFNVTVRRCPRGRQFSSRARNVATSSGR